MSQQSPILVPDSDDDEVSVASAGAVEARRLQEQFDAEARRARGDDEATQRLVARLAAPAVDDERSLRLARSLAAPPSEDASLRLARWLSGEPHNELKDVLGRALASDEFTVETSSSSLSGTNIGDCCDMLAPRRCAGLLQVGPLEFKLVARVGLARFRPAALRVVNVL